MSIFWCIILRDLFKNKKEKEKKKIRKGEKNKK